MQNANGAKKGQLFVISGPSGAGKGTLVKALLAARQGIWVSISATTRQPRKGEVDGVDYIFLSKDEFAALVDKDGFLEWAQVHDCCYGTMREPVEKHLAMGEHVILEIDTQGAFQVRNSFPQALLIFIEPPSLEELEARLVARGTENACQISRRIETAKLELLKINEYDIVVKNDVLEIAIKDLIAVFDNYNIGKQE